MTDVREFVRSLHDRLIFLPVVFVIGGVAVSQVAIRTDRLIDDDALPRILRTTVSSADSILSTIAGGLISAITLLLSLVLVTVQLASSQFSPRTLRDWIGDRTQQITIGLVLGTTVYCLMVLRETQSFDDDTTVAPDLSVLLAVLLAVLCLVAVVRSVGHLSNSMRINSVALELATDTVATLRKRERLDHSEAPGAVAQDRIRPAFSDFPNGWSALIAPRAGWVRHISPSALVREAPDGATVRITASVGAFVLEGEPLAWIDVAGEDERPCPSDALTIAETRLLDDDASYGLLQMNDIALRALSPGVNDPNTACDVVVHIGLVLLAAWEQETPDTVTLVDGRMVLTDELDHAAYLDAAFAQIRRYGSSDVSVCTTLLRTLGKLEREVRRRELPGPIEPIRAEARRVVAEMEASDMLEHDREIVRRVADEIALDERVPVVTAPATGGVAVS